MGRFGTGLANAVKSGTGEEVSRLGSLYKAEDTRPRRSKNMGDWNLSFPPAAVSVVSEERLCVFGGGSVNTNI